MSYRCYGVRPSGPPAEPLGEERIAFTMSLAVTEMGWGRKSSCKGGIAKLGWSGGCLSWRAAKVASSGGARDSSELAIQTSSLKSPSSSLAETRNANDLIGFFGRYCLLLEQGLALTFGRSASASICLLTSVVKDAP